jgi:AraC-like DNA-binding protein
MMTPVPISQLTSYIDANLGEVQSASQVVNYAGYSLAVLNRRFQKIYRLSLKRYLVRAQVARMKEMLQDRDTLCKVVCLELGLREDVGSRIFKRETGMTMQEFRNQGDVPRD